MQAHTRMWCGGCGGWAHRRAWCRSAAKRRSTATATRCSSRTCAAARACPSERSARRPPPCWGSAPPPPAATSSSSCAGPPPRSGRYWLCSAPVPLVFLKLSHVAMPLWCRGVCVPTAMAVSSTLVCWKPALQRASEWRDARVCH